MGPGNPQRRFGSRYIATHKQVSPMSESILLFVLDKLFSKATHLTPVNLVSLLKCSLEGQRAYAVDIWKLLFQKASPALDQALVTFTKMVRPSLDCTKALMSCVDSLCDLMLFPICRPPTIATHPCRMLLRLSERWQLPTSARRSCRVMPLSATGSRQRWDRFWPLHPPTSYSAFPPRTSAAKHIRLCKQIRDMFPHCDQDCSSSCIFTCC